MDVRPDTAGETAGRLLEGMRRIVRGKDEFLLRLLSCLFAGGHVLIEDLPGLGKTTVAKTLAALIAGGADADDQASAPGRDRYFRRIQCTPDLLPYDITGVDVFNPETRTFEFNPGPVFAHILLADEINRTTPKVQSALLEVMAEGQVTVGLRTHTLEKPFFVMATQNPVEIEGTYLLPLAQADRFLMKLSIGYPDGEAEYSIVVDNPSAGLDGLMPVCTPADVLAVQGVVAGVYCDPKLVKAVIALAEATRTHSGIRYGVSPRGSLMLVQAARAFAFLHGRAYVVDQDIIDLAPLVLSHRIKMKDLRMSPENIVRETVVGVMKNRDGG